jgi:hypothetical protein
VTARRVSLKERREQRRAKRPRTRDVPHPFLLPVISMAVKPGRKDAG